MKTSNPSNYHPVFQLTCYKNGIKESLFVPLDTSDTQ